MAKKQFLKFFQENEFDVQSSANTALLACDVVFSAFANSKIIGQRIGDGYGFVSPDYSQPFYEIWKQSEMMDFSRKVHESYKRNPNILKKIMKDRVDLLKIIEEKSLVLVNVDVNSKIFYKQFNEYIKLSRIWWENGIVGEDKGQVIDFKIIPNFAKRHNYSIEKARDIWSLLAHPDKQSFFNSERIDFYNLCLLYSQSQKLRNETEKEYKLLKQAVIKYQKKYFWLKTNFYRSLDITPELIVEEIKKELKERRLNEIRNDLKKLSSAYSRIEKEKNKIKQTIIINKTDKADLDFTKNYTYWQDLRKVQMMKYFFYFLHISKKISDEKVINYDDLMFYTNDELMNFLRTNKKILKKKQSIFTVYKKNYKQEIFCGKIARDILSAILKVDQAKEIKGVVASKGKEKKYKGIVRIIINPERQEFNQGEILVTSMTRVEFIPLMRKAKAIITDEGGIACHAAIVSRELSIPCVIGTKNATKILKDNDKVEIDIGNGIVKIIK